MFAGYVQAVKAYGQNRWSVVRQLHFSNTRTSDSVDMVLMVNGLPILTMELKNELSCQNVSHAVSQYKNDRDPKELLFAPKRCAVHFAVDDAEVMMCTALAGEKSWFLPFNKGVNDGAGNPVNPNGLKTAYLWEDILQKANLSDILENYAQMVREKDEETGRTKEKCIWPRYHQLEAVRLLLADTKAHEGGQRYLIQHSAGSGKFEEYMKKIYYLSYGSEVEKPNGGHVQFLDAAKAIRVNSLHFTDEPKRQNLKTYYEFVHQQRNEESHKAPVIADREVKIGIHMVMALYLYATMINIRQMEP